MLEPRPPAWQYEGNGDLAFVISHTSWLLRRAVAAGHLPEAEARELGADLLEAVGRLHDRRLPADAVANSFNRN